MPCNCKKRLEKIEEKYGDNPIVTNKSLNIWLKILKFILQIPFGILVGGIVIVILIPMLAYIIFCMMFGLEAKFRIIDWNKRLNNKR